MKSGVKTTEFWASLIAKALVLWVTFRGMDASRQKAISDAIPDMALTATAVCAIWGVTAKYTHSRFMLKVQEMAREAGVPVATSDSDAS